MEMSRAQLKNQEMLTKIKDQIKDSYQYFKPNYDRYHEYMQFVFNTSLSEDDRSVLQDLRKPPVEFNILEAYISRQLGEFSKQEPSIYVTSENGEDDADPRLIDTLDGYFRHILFDANRNNMEYHTYRDCMAGGFSAVEIYTDWSDEMSFNQNIYWRRVADPTKTGFDKMALLPHKGDGQFCFKLYPKTRTEFEADYGKKYTKNMKFNRNIGDFNWSYASDTKSDDMLLMGDFYSKKIMKKKIVLLVSGEVILLDDYEKKLAEHNARTDIFIAFPGVVGKPRETEIVTIERHVVTETDILEETPTDFKFLPIVYVDGNSVMLQGKDQGAMCQMTRPYIYHARDAQKLKNFAGSTLANELENMVQAKWIVQKEAIPEESTDAYVDIQKSTVIPYNGFHPQDATIQLSAPTPVPRVPAPPEISATFMGADSMVQSILGSYDASLGINNNQLSGVAIVEGATQSNATAMPFVVNYMQGIDRLAQNTMHLIPKVLTFPRKIPIRDKKGERDTIKINEPGEVSMDFAPNTMNVKVEAGVNYEIQRNRAFDATLKLIEISPVMAEFFTTKEAGIRMLLSNMDIRGIDAIRGEVSEFCQQKEQEKMMMQQQQQQQMQLEMQNNPAEIKKLELQQKQQEAETNAFFKASELDLKAQEMNIKEALAINEITNSSDEQVIQAAKIDAQNARTEVEMAISRANSHHSHAMDILSLHHETMKNMKKMSQDESRMKNSKKSA